MEIKHHITPRVLLRRFADQDGRLLVYPRDGGPTFVSSAEKVVREGGFYALEEPSGEEVDGPAEQESIEHLLGTIETEAGPALEKLVSGGPEAVKAEERAYVVVFVGLQVTRGWAFREDIKKMLDGAGKGILRAGAPHKAAEWVRDHARPEDKMSVESLVEFLNSDRYEISFNKNYILATMLKGSFEAVIPHLGRPWRIYEFDDPVLVTSDEPVGYWVSPMRRRGLPGVGVGNADVVFPIPNCGCSWMQGLDESASKRIQRSSR